MHKGWWISGKGCKHKAREMCSCWAGKRTTVVEEKQQLRIEQEWQSAETTATNWSLQAENVFP